MIRARLIPILLIDRHRRVVKTVQFGDRTYIGDPFNIVRLFNEKEVDEICVLDIDATADGRSVDTGFIAELASECFMPLAYGGGIADLRPCETLARAGVEKFVIGTAAAEPAMLRTLADIYGSQAVIGCVDYHGDRKGAASVRNGRDQLVHEAPVHARALEQAGAGEVILQSIDRDGMRQGMDLAMIETVSRLLSIPLIALGGAGSVSDLATALDAGASAAASGSAFSFIGRLRAVLVTYPDYAEWDALLGARA